VQPAQMQNELVQRQGLNQSMVMIWKDAPGKSLAGIRVKNRQQLLSKTVHAGRTRPNDRSMLEAGGSQVKLPGRIGEPRGRMPRPPLLPSPSQQLFALLLSQFAPKVLLVVHQAHNGRC
jgi:hypothetical protein